MSLQPGTWQSLTRRGGEESLMQNQFTVLWAGSGDLGEKSREAGWEPVKAVLGEGRPGSCGPAGRDHQPVGFQVPPGREQGMDSLSSLHPLVSCPASQGLNPPRALLKCWPKGGWAEQGEWIWRVQASGRGESYKFKGRPGKTVLRRWHWSQDVLEVSPTPVSLRLRNPL